MKKKKIKAIAGISLGGILATSGIGFMFAQTALNGVQTEVNLNLSKNNIDNSLTAATSHASFNSMEDANFKDAASTEKLIKRYHVENGLVRLINGNADRITLDEIVKQIYAFGTTGTTLLKYDKSEFDMIESIIVGIFGIDYLSEGARTGLSEIFLLKKEKEIVEQIEKLTTNEIADQQLVNQFKNLVNNDHLLVTKNVETIRTNFMQAATNKGFLGTSINWQIYSYNWFPFSENQAGIFKTFAKYNVKAMFNSVPIEYSLKRGNGMIGWSYYNDPAESELNRMGVDWLISHFGNWRDINYGAKSGMFEPGKLRDAFSESARIGNQKFYENLDTDSDDGQKNIAVVPQGYLNDERIESEMVPYFSKMQFGVMQQFGTRLAPYDVDNEPNIDINYGWNFGLTPKQYARLGKGVHDQIGIMTRNINFTLSNADISTNNANTGGAISYDSNGNIVTNSGQIVNYGSDGMDLTISLDSHSRIQADETFGLWQGVDTPNNENNLKKWGIKGYITEITKYWPEVLKNSIFTYHTYWDYNPEIISDLYKWATEGGMEIVNKNYDLFAGIVPNNETNNFSNIDPHTTVITELSYNFWPDSKIDNDGMGGFGSDNNTWFMALGYAYQMHSHSRYTRSQSFMPYHGAERYLSDYMSDEDKYLSDERVYAQDLNGELLKNADGNNIHQILAGVTPSLHVYEMLEAGDLHLNTLSNAIENDNKSILGDVWISANKSKLKLFFLNDSEVGKNIDINLDGYTANDIWSRNILDEIAGTSSGENDDLYADVDLEHISIMHGVSNREQIGQVTQDGLLGIKYLRLEDEVSGRESLIKGLGTSSIEIDLPAWSMYSVALEIS